MFCCVIMFAAAGLIFPRGEALRLREKFLETRFLFTTKVKWDVWNEKSVKSSQVKYEPHV